MMEEMRGATSESAVDQRRMTLKALIGATTIRIRDVEAIVRAKAPAEERALRRLVEANGDTTKVRQLVQEAAEASEVRVLFEQVCADGDDDQIPEEDVMRLDPRRGRRVPKGSYGWRLRNRASTRKPTTQDSRWLSDELERLRRAAGITDQ